MNFSKFFKSSNRYNNVILVSFVVLAIIGVLTLMGGNSSRNVSGYKAPIFMDSSRKIDVPVSMPMPVSLPQNDATSFLDNSNSKSLEEDIISNMAPIITNENLGNASYLPVIDTDLGATELNDLN
jgi:hypothetical protein